MKRKPFIKCFKISDEFELTDFSFDRDKIIGDSLFGEGCIAQIVDISYEPFFEALSKNGFSKDCFVALVDEEGKLKELPLNFVASFLCGQMIVGDVYIVKISKHGFVDIHKKEYDFLKAYFGGMISVVIDELASILSDDN